MSKNVLVSVHCYAGDAHQVRMLMPVYTHHGYPVYIMSPEDSKVTDMGPHLCFHDGLRGYTGYLTWKRQYLQMKRLLTFDFDFYLMHDADSFCFSPPLPDYLFEDTNAFFSNQVNDFRKPGETWTDANGSVTWPETYHRGYPLLAFQPSYFVSRQGLEKLVKAFEDGVEDDPVTPFIDWVMVVLAVNAKLNYQPFRNCVSCETETDMGLRLVGDKVREGVTFVHAVKRQHAFNVLADIYRSTLK